MAVLRNVSSVGAVDVPIARLSVEAGAEFTVPKPVAAVLLRQAVNFVPVDDEAKAVAADLAAEAAAALAAAEAVEAAAVVSGAPVSVAPAKSADAAKPAKEAGK
jgi:hypothetical protein